MILALVNKVYYDIFKKSNVSKEDPDYQFILDLLSEIQKEKLETFYRFFVSKEEFHPNGFSSIPLFVRAQKNFIQDEKEAIWKYYHLEEKCKDFYWKVMGIYNYLYEKEGRPTGVLLAIEKLNPLGFKNGNTGEKMFTEEEILLMESLSLKDILEKHISDVPFYSIQEMIEEEYKKILLKKYWNEASNDGGVKKISLFRQTKHKESNDEGD